MPTDVFNNPVVFTDTVSFTTVTLPANAVTNSTVIAGAEIGRAKLALESKKYLIPLTDLRVWDAMQTNLPGTGAADDLALIGGTFGTGSPSIQTGDVKASSTTRRARFLVPLPAEYENAGTVTLRASAGMVTTVSDTTATIDFEVYESNKTTGIGSDLCATAATTINSLTFGDKDFSITAAGLVAGDLLDVRVSIAVVDGATATAVIGAIGSLELICQVRG
jgi:hypothetical protein